MKKFKLYSHKYWEYRKNTYNSREEAQKVIDDDEWDCEEEIIEVEVKDTEENKLNWLNYNVAFIDEAVDTEKIVRDILKTWTNKLEIYSKKQDKIIFDYINIEEIDDEILTMAKIESVLNERPQYMTKEAIKQTLKVFDEYYLLIVNGKTLW